jgi:hypothetical protein
MAKFVTKEPVTVDLKDVDTLDTAEIALRITEQQKVATGTTYGYCACGNAVSRLTASKAAKRDKLPECRPCSFRRRVSEKRKAEAVYLCAICRCPVTSTRRLYAAREAVKVGRNFSCGKPECRLALIDSKKPALSSRAREQMSRLDPTERKLRASRAARAPRYKYCLPRVVCTRCGEPVSSTSATKARKTGRLPWCGKHNPTHEHKTHCKRGHPLDVSNVYMDASGARHCLECRRLRERAQRKSGAR